MMAEKLVEAIRKPIVISDLTFVVSASMGISIYPEDGTECDVLLKAADSAMYQAKALGKDNFHFFTKAIAARSMKYVTLERDMKDALKQHEFELYYQPQMRLKDNKIVGLEALIRWNHPSRGLITPNEFIHIADDSDMIDSITEWVISTALSDHEEWSDHGCNGLRVAVNITGRQFIRERSIKKVIDVLNTFDPESHYLKLDLEITETAFEHVSQVVKVINMLKKRDVVFSIDDFGTGHSSLSRLKEIPVESLKIDQSFIRDMTSDNDDKEIVRAIISMGHSLGMRVIGEGVENIDQLEILQELGCDEIQGFYISLPLPADQITKLLDQQRRDYQELN
jgi:EAL domain-containing protein (putative c-di-GMP-specific phosphodiesterase class I)